MELLKLLSTNEIVVQVISFLLLLFFLRIFAWEKLLKLLDTRKEKIETEFKNIEEAKSSVEQLRVEFETKIKSIEELARQKIEQAASDAQKAALEIKKNAHIEAGRIIEDARAYSKYELSKTKEQLKEEIIDLVLKSTEDLIGEKLSEEADKKIVQGFLDNLDSGE